MTVVQANEGMSYVRGHVPHAIPKGIYAIALAVLVIMAFYPMADDNAAYALVPSPQMSTQPTVAPAPLATSKHKHTPKLAKRKPKLATPQNTSNGLRLFWAKVKGAKGYKIYRKGASKKSKYKRIKTIKKATTLAYKDKKAKGGKSYYYKLKAYKGKVSSKYAYTGKWFFYHVYTEHVWYKVGKDIPAGTYIVVSKYPEVSRELNAYTTSSVFYGGTHYSVLKAIDSNYGYLWAPKGGYMYAPNCTVYLAKEVKRISRVTPIVYDQYNGANAYSAGMYKVGTDIPVGTYRIVLVPYNPSRTQQTVSPCCCTVFSDAGIHQMSNTPYLVDNSATVNVTKGEYIKATQCSIQKIG